MVFQEIYASRHFQVDASSIILLRALSQMIRMKTCQSLSTRPSIGQEISMPWAHSQFVYLFLAGRDKTATVKKDFSFANLRMSTLIAFFHLHPTLRTQCGQMVKYIIRTRLYWNGSNILFFTVQVHNVNLRKKGATHFEDDRKVMYIFQSVSENFVIRMTDR